VFARDKIQHFVAGLFIYVLLDFVGRQANIGLSPVYIILLVLLAGIGKEVLDKLSKRDVELMDIVATVLGGLFAMAISSLSLFA